MSDRRFWFKLICRQYIKETSRQEDFRQLPRPYYSIAYVEKGRLECTEDGRTIMAEEGDVVFFPYHLRYILRWCAEPESSVYSCHFLLPPSVDLFSMKEIRLQKIRGEDLREDFLFLHSNIHGKEQTLQVLGRFYGLCHKIYERLEQSERAPMNKWVRKAVEYIHANYDRPIAVETLAKIAHMSPSRFHHVFKEETGMTPLDYKNRTTIRQAEMLLESAPDRSVEEISIEMGFSSSTYFRRVFKAVTGMTPRDYRKRIANPIEKK